MRCLSCGTPRLTGKRKFCSDECQIRLKNKLEQQKGLLISLDTYYAVFSFTDKMIVLDILPRGFSKIFSFIYPRSVKGKPADDFGKLAKILGNAWWEEKKKTNKNHLAKMVVLDHAIASRKDVNSVKPAVHSLPSVKNKYLKCLELGRDELNHTHVQDTIKSAFRIQAKKHHPDVGGDTDMFRKIHEAYGELACWAKDPSYIRRKGLPDKWLYDGTQNKWLMPILAG